jgi:aryl-alcohol dehydrogenase-like predicted oxidoreductase
VALAWLLSRGTDIVPIPGTSKVKRLEENLATLAKGIAKPALDELTRRIDAGKVAGLRYPAGQMKSLGI